MLLSIPSRRLPTTTRHTIRIHPANRYHEVYLDSKQLQSCSPTFQAHKAPITTAGRAIFNKSSRKIFCTSAMEAPWIRRMAISERRRDTSSRTYATSPVRAIIRIHKPAKKHTVAYMQHSIIKIAHLERQGYIPSTAGEMVRSITCCTSFIVSGDIRFKATYKLLEGLFR